MLYVFELKHDFKVGAHIVAADWTEAGKTADKELNRLARKNGKHTELAVVGIVVSDRIVDAGKYLLRG